MSLRAVWLVVLIIFQSPGLLKVLGTTEVDHLNARLLYEFARDPAVQSIVVYLSRQFTFLSHFHLANTASSRYIQIFFPSSFHAVSADARPTQNPK